MAVKGLPDKVADLADRVADRVVEALMKAGFDRQFVDALLRAFKEQVEERDG